MVSVTATLIPELRERLERLELEDRFWDEHFPGYLVEYPGCVVAIRGNEFLGAASSYEELDAILVKAGLDPRDVSTRYVGRPGEAFIY